MCCCVVVVVFMFVCVSPFPMLLGVLGDLVAAWEG